jgi:hypothetical protein
MFSALVFSYHRQPSKRVVHGEVPLFPDYVCGCHADEQAFIFRIEIFAFALLPDLILRRRGSAVSKDEWH